MKLIIGPYVDGYCILDSSGRNRLGYFAIGGLWEILPDIIRLRAYNRVNFRNTPRI